MKIHEYQAKELFGAYGIAITDQAVISDASEASAAAERLGGTVVVKAQVLVGGRGKAGGVKLADNPADAAEKAKAILGMDIKGETVEKVLIAPAADILKEYYVGLIMDRASKKIILMVTKEGGVEIEELAVTDPDKIIKFPIDIATGIDEDALRSVLTDVFEKPGLVEQATDTVKKMYTLFVEKDASLVEINPYALVDETTLMALDAKMNFDDNALYKHDDVDGMKNPEEYSQDEIDAKKFGLSFVSMDGDIGCIVNGAGLAMATMDIVKLFGGDPANFLDVGGSSNPEKVLNAIEIILRNRKVRAILINIFGGITRCDDIAKGIIMATDQIDIKVPMVIRLVGTNQEEGRAMLEEKGFDVADDLSDAVRKVVAS
ncbi:MAG: ADP-forming succinate--CoA ligase subunit beta [Spirochaeta sp.]|jgi:succinyl-CoA synthetase beta subunit|nr:ADP-forming succinate--CoA ligase subunit beta [Spirochaeta sp.]